MKSTFVAEKHLKADLSWLIIISNIFHPNCHDSTHENFCWCHFQKLSGEYEALGKIASVRMKNRDWVCSGKQPHELHQVWQPSLANSKYIIKLMVFLFLEDINSNSTGRSLASIPSTQCSSSLWLVSTSTSSIPYFLWLYFLSKLSI